MQGGGHGDEDAFEEREKRSVIKKKVDGMTDFRELDRIHHHRD